MTERDLELLSSYLDDALSSDERAALTSRLASDSDLRRELELLRETKLLVAALPQLRAPRPLTLTAAQVGTAVPRRAVLHSPWVSIASAAASFLLIAAGVLSVATSGLAPRAAMVASQPTLAATMTGVTAPSALPPATAAQALVAPAASASASEALAAAATLAVTGTSAPTQDAAAAMMAMPTPAAMGTQLPPGVAEEAARGDGIVPITYTPVPQSDVANAIMDTGPAGGFAPEDEQELTTPAADLMLESASSVTDSADVLETMLPGQFGEVTGAGVPQEGATLLIDPASTALAYAATASPSPAPTESPPPTFVPTRDVGADAAPIEQPFRDPMGIGFIVAGMLFLFVAIVTTLIRLRR